MTILRKGAISPHLHLAINTLSSSTDLLADSAQWREEVTSVITAAAAYAILSHRWLDKGELNFKDLKKLDGISASGFQQACAQRSAQRQLNSATILDLAYNLNAIPANQPRDGAELLHALTDFCSGLSPDQKAQYADLVKFVQFCVIAKEQRCDYAWMDSCCIDKSSSAELEESIRSMFRWYRHAKICIVQLADTHTSTFYMRRDAWFTRGWTLQELLAPKTIKFFDRDWCPLTHHSNDKVDDTTHVPLWHTISEITGISPHQLLHFTPGMHNARETMVWASKRTTTRIEDVAYSLIGLLDVPLSIAYGEGPMAFYRLQVEIVQRSHDRGIFAWQGERSTHNTMFAASPKCFFVADIYPLPRVQRAHSEMDRTHAVTNYGMRMPLSLYKVENLQVTARSGGPNPYTLKVTALGDDISILSGDALSANDRLAIAILANGTPDESEGKSLALLLSYCANDDQYTRVATEELIWVKRLAQWKPTETIYIK